jgi:formylglycine-generating enzyme required for sulfatase activity
LAVEELSAVGFLFFFLEDGKMRKVRVLIILVCLLATVNFASADTFGTGDNAFDIDFVPISGDASSANGTNISGYSPGDSAYKTFSDPGNDYRIGTYEITNAQWTKFKAAYDAVTGGESGYGKDPYWTGSSVPTNCTSWYEAAQFVNWLNTSKNYQPAYKFTGDIHTSSYTLGVWSSQEADGTNLYRNKNAKYFLPTENEWVKAAYWNGSSLQNYATKAGETLFQGNGSNGGWNYYNNGYAINPYGPWAVGSGSQELNGTYDMMGNVWEWMESPYYTGEHLSGSIRNCRGGSYYSGALYDFNAGYGLASSFRGYTAPYDENGTLGFRVASIPEPATLLLLGFGGLVLRRGRK